MDEDDARPLTRDELKAKTLSRLQRRGHGAGKAKSSQQQAKKATKLTTK